MAFEVKNTYGSRSILNDLKSSQQQAHGAPEHQRPRTCPQPPAPVQQHDYSHNQQVPIPPTSSSPSTHLQRSPQTYPQHLAYDYSSSYRQPPPAHSHMHHHHHNSSHASSRSYFEKNGKISLPPLKLGGASHEKRPDTMASASPLNDSDIFALSKFNIKEGLDSKHYNHHPYNQHPSSLHEQRLRNGSFDSVNSAQPSLFSPITSRSSSVSSSLSPLSPQHEAFSSAQNNHVLSPVSSSTEMYNPMHYNHPPPPPPPFIPEQHQHHFHPQQQMHQQNATSPVPPPLPPYHPYSHSYHMVSPPPHSQQPPPPPPPSQQQQQQPHINYAVSTLPASLAQPPPIPQQPPQQPQQLPPQQPVSTRVASSNAVPLTQSPAGAASLPASSAATPGSAPPLKHKKKYICSSCQKGFTTSGHLARHTRIHTGEKNYECPHPDCSMRFARQDNCMQHYRIHLGGRSRATAASLAAAALNNGSGPNGMHMAIGRSTRGRKTSR